MGGLCAVLFGLHGAAQDLETRFDERGLTRLAYRGVALVDLDASLGDSFSVGGYKLGSHDGWGANEKRADWDVARKIVTWRWAWGSVVCRFVPVPEKNELQFQIAVENKSGDALTGISIYPLGLQFPALPQGFGAPNYPQFKNNLDGPAVIQASYGAGSLVLANMDAQPLYLGLSPSQPANHYKVQVGTLNDSSEGFLSKAVPVSRSVPAGGRAGFNIAMRFAPAESDSAGFVRGLLKTYAEAWPQKLRWKDRRPIGELFMTAPTATPIPDSNPNPRNYTVAKQIDVRTGEGAEAFGKAVLGYADNAVRILKGMNAQGMLVWDLEGQQYPQPNTSYVGDPRKLADMSPEMNAVADAFFKRFTDAGLKCGMTIRPQRFDAGTTRPPVQKDVAAAEQSALMIEKISYARKRWGCTMFYVDSDGGPQDATDPAAFAAVAKALPDVLIIPENIWPKHYAYTAPLASFTAPYKPLHTPAEVRSIWPGAFTVTYVGDAPGGSLKSRWGEFVEAVRAGDILSFRAWFDDEPLNSEVREIYRQAGVSGKP